MLSKQLILYAISLILIIITASMVVDYSGLINQENFDQNFISTNQADQLYFAYGSNMNLAQMQERCGTGFKKIRTARLDNYEFGFDQRGYANIRPRIGEFVWGVAWLITPECIASLDGYEDYPDTYNKRIVSAKDSNLQDLDVFVYIENAENFGGVAQKDYLNNKIIVGAKENGLPDFWIKKLEQYK